jgi:hypothetical protein
MKKRAIDPSAKRLSPPLLATPIIPSDERTIPRSSRRQVNSLNGARIRADDVARLV